MGYKFVYNFSFFNFHKGVVRAKQIGIFAIKLWPWRYKKEYFKELKKAGIHYAIAPFLVSEQRHKELVQKHGSLWVAVDDPKKRDQWCRGI